MISPSVSVSQGLLFSADFVGPAGDGAGLLCPSVNHSPCSVDFLSRMVGPGDESS
jgi:hypothetical protein